MPACEQKKFSLEYGGTHMLFKASNLSPHKGTLIEFISSPIDSQLTKLGQKNASNDRSEIALSPKCFYWKFQPREKAKTRWRWNERRKFPFHLIIYTLIHRFTNLKWKPIELHKITAWWIPSCSLTQSLVYADFILCASCFLLFCMRIELLLCSAQLCWRYSQS